MGNGDKPFKVTHIVSNVITLECVCNWDIDRFELVDSALTIEQKIALAESIIGKEVSYLDSKVGNAKTWDIVRKGVGASYAVNRVTERDGYCVTIRLASDLIYPVEELTIVVPEFKEHKLNDTYTAKIYDDRVEVGCQTFTKDTIKQLAKLL